MKTSASLSWTYGTAARVISLPSGTSAPDLYLDYHQQLYHDVVPFIPSGLILVGDSRVENDPDRMLALANMAYANLQPGDRDETELWDATIGDGLED
jgi:hypothetical protein